MRVLKYSRDDFHPLKYDYIFEKIKDFEKMLPYLYPKIEGTWNIILVDFTFEEMEHIIKDLNIPDYLDVKSYLRADAYNSFLIKYREYACKEESKWDSYLGYLATVPRLLDTNAVNAIYKRCHGALPLIKEKIEELLQLNTEDTITLRDVNSVILDDDIVYGRDVILSLWIKGNSMIEKRGSILSKYKYGLYSDYRDKLVSSLGETYAFYSIRKFLRMLYQEKIKYLKGADVKNKEICRVIDIDSILFAYVTFELSNPAQLLVCLEAINKRENNDASIFENTILANYTKYNRFTG